ncbi:batten's disease protein Cln3 [Dacryopinax primogenitus]|uniref:Protein BTN n=1 Tax=Dacryopinax primogenitus (strain DJM 731) TaxID=1858805 RepID=M5GBC5_DACPD|nr:batten's disease protein Cln3 [Dacryopinax primogenitus]EJU01293.1 batten's disease protein Cln3 [Dacryopinax primogenitus]
MSSDTRIPNEEDASPTAGLLSKSNSSQSSHARLRLSLSFWLFGLINNVLYVIILSAALDLVPPSTPKGIIAFANIAPAMVSKVVWPYALKGKIRYAQRVWGCTLLSVGGMIIVAAGESLTMRLIGIAIASFSSGLGELTWLQLSTSYNSSGEDRRGLGYFASGTGAAGLVGAGLWWMLRALGVREGVGISSVLPFVIPLAYHLLLPKPAALASLSSSENTSNTYASLPTEDAEDVGIEADALESKVISSALTGRDKWVLVKPLMLRYILPLFCVYTFEYTINQGIGPTLVYPVPSPLEHPFLAQLITSVRDYYPLWQLVYQSFVFFSRSSLSLGLPPLPYVYLPLPSFLQFLILLTLAYEAYHGILSSSPDSDSGVLLVFVLIACEGICGGLAYVNAFYHVSQETASPSESPDPERSKQEREFRIGSIGFGDTSGILLASLIAMPTEVALCNAQAKRGKMICKTL